MLSETVSTVTGPLQHIEQTGCMSRAWESRAQSRRGFGHASVLPCRGFCYKQQHLPEKAATATPTLPETDRRRGPHPWYAIWTQVEDMLALAKSLGEVAEASMQTKDGCNQAHGFEACRRNVTHDHESTSMSSVGSAIVQRTASEWQRGPGLVSLCRVGCWGDRLLQGCLMRPKCNRCRDFDTLVCLCSTRADQAVTLIPRASSLDDNVHQVWGSHNSPWRGSSDGVSTVY